MSAESEAIEKLKAQSEVIETVLARVVELIAPKPASPPPAIPVEVIEQRASNAVIWIMLLGVVLSIGLVEYRKRNAPPKPDDVPVVVETETPAVALGEVDDRWAALAVWVESGKVDTTGELLSIARQLDLDTARLKPLIDKPAKITDANRQRILDLIGGVE